MKGCTTTFNVHYSSVATHKISSFNKTKVKNCFPFYDPFKDHTSQSIPVAASLAFSSMDRTRKASSEQVGKWKKRVTVTERVEKCRGAKRGRIDTESRIG